MKEIYAFRMDVQATLDWELVMALVLMESLFYMSVRTDAKLLKVNDHQI